ncbi:MAG: iron ABC transporter permease [Pseudohongiellaceae bacterium]
MERHHYILLGCLCLLAIASFALSLASGSIPVSLPTLMEQWWQADGGMERDIVVELRIPRTLAAFVTGALLALSGVVMQVLLRNPLADPYILGVSGGAAVGALGAILLGLGGAWVSNAAFLGAVSSIAIVFGLASLRGEWNPVRLLLTGVVVSAGWGALINLLLATTSGNTVQSMLFWLMGDLARSRVDAGHFAVLLAGLVILFLVARSLNALARGEQLAASLGVNTGRLKVLLYFTASVLTATAVTVAGSIGFVGLVIPHMLRLLGARDHRVLLPASALLGGSFLVVADGFARTIIAPQQLPVGVVTAIIGVPVFLFILHRSHRQTV